MGLLFKKGQLELELKQTIFLKMQLYFIGVVKPISSTEAIILTYEEDLSSFSYFFRGKVSELVRFFATTVAARTPVGQRQTIEEEGYHINVFARSEGVSGVLITDKTYPIRPAYTLINKVLDEFISTYPPDQWKLQSTTPTDNKYALSTLSEYIRKYQDPTQSDALMRVQQELDETKVVLHKTINATLQRGENLDTLVDKSGELSSSSKGLFQQAKKTNSCCVIM